MESLAFGDLAIRVAAPEPPAPIELVWTGQSNDRQPRKVLDPFLSGVIDEAAARSVGVESHFEGLEHFNSSTITAIIGFVQRARSRNVRLVLLFDKALRWQKLSFDAIRVLGRGDELLEIRPV
jgi:hypothetical protein